MGQISQTQVGMKSLQYLQEINFLRLAIEDGMWKILLVWSYMTQVVKSLAPQPSTGKGVAGSSTEPETGPGSSVSLPCCSWVWFSIQARLNYTYVYKTESEFLVLTILQFKYPSLSIYSKIQISNPFYFIESQ